MSNDRSATLDGSGQLKALTAPAPYEGPQLLSDPVPRLRADLKIEPKRESPGLVDVQRTDSDQSFTLYDIELSIARMLDGRRTVSKLIEQAGKIGIPVTLESLRKFLRQLHAYGFLDDGVGEANGPWPAREEWRPEVRDLYQSALRTFRVDRFEEAKRYLEALQQIEPDLAEAMELSARIQERELFGETPKPPSFDELHGDPDVDDEGAPKKRSRKGLLFAGVGLCALGAAAAIPVPYQVPSAVRLSPTTPPTIVVVPRSGKVAKLFAAKGAWVEKGQKLAQLSTDELDAHAQSIEKELSELDGRIAHLADAANRRAAQKAEATLEKKKKSLASLEQKRPRMASHPRALAKLEQRIAKAQRDVEHAQESYDRAARTKDLAQAKAEREAKAKDLTTVKSQLAASLIVAPATGEFEPSRREGDPVVDAVGTVSDTRTLDATLSIRAADAQRVKPGQRLTFSSDQIKTPISATIVSVSGSGEVALAHASIANADRKLPADSTGVAEIDCGRVPLLSRLLRR